MVSAPQGPKASRVYKRKRFPWLLGMVVSLGFITILAFLIVTLLILQSQGISQGINTLTVISIVIGFIISVLSLLISFLQWHHPQRGADRPELSLAPLPQVSENANPHLLPSSIKKSHPIDWGEAPDSEQLYGREEELVELRRWLLDEHCRLVALLGMGGIGKTSLAASLVDLVHEHYDSIFWRSLHNAPPLSSVLQECIQFVSAQAGIVQPAEIDRQISLLIDSFRTSRCLLILDNVESILQGGSQTGSYREGYEGYGRLLLRIGESKHQSCLLIMSREKPPEVALLEGDTVVTRSLNLGGLKSEAGRDILKGKGLQGSERDWEALITHYAGNPLALKLGAEVIREVFGGTIIVFLRDGERFFCDVRDVLEQQMQRLSALEEEIVYWLAIEREAVTLSDLQERIVHPVSTGGFQEALRSLRRRQLIATQVAGFTLHHVIMEYLTDRFVERVCEEIRTERLILFERHAVLLAQAKDHIRESQCRLILQPLLRRLLALFGKEALEQRFQSLLAALREQHNQHVGYAAGNMLNLLIQMGGTLRGYDFSHLVVRQAYLQGAELPKVNFAHANLATSVFTDTFGGILCVAWSRQADLLAAGTVTGEIRFWSAANGLPLQTLWGHTDWVFSVTFSPDGRTLASGSDDQTVRLWEVNSGKLLHTLSDHSHWVRSVAFSPDGKLLASGSHDQTVRLWEVSSGKSLSTLCGHSHWVWGVTFSPDGKTLASGSEDQTLRLWDVSSGKSLSTLHGHTNAVRSVAFSPDGKLLASGSEDQTVRLWEVSSGKSLSTLCKHSHWVWSVAFSPDGRTLASGSEDQTVRLWEVSSGKSLSTLHGHTNAVRSVAFSPDGKTLASGSYDQTVRLWEISSGKLLNTLRGYTNAVQSVIFSPDGKTLASGSYDQTVRLWEVSSGKLLNTLRGHADRVWSVAFSPDSQILASSSSDRTVRLWEVSSGKLLNTLCGHADVIWSVAFNPDGKTLASGSYDRTVRLWEVSSGKSLTTLQGHSHWVSSVAFSPDGKTLAAGSDDRTICLWEASSGQCFNILCGHASVVWSVAFSPDGKTLVSGSNDQTVRLWEVSSGKSLNTLHGHSHWVYSVAFSPDGQTLVSGSYDGVMNLWNGQTGTCLRTWRSDRPYEHMNITQVQGLTGVQKATLKLLGATEDEGQPQQELA